MRLLSIALLAMTFSSTAHAAGKKNPSFLSEAAGTYVYVSGDCSAPEARVEYDAENRTLYVNRVPVNDGYTSWMSFDRINRRRQRHGSDMFTYIDEKATLEGGRLRDFERQCAGIIIVSCGEWSVVADVELADGTDGTRLHIRRAGYRDNGCIYLRRR